MTLKVRFVLASATAAAFLFLAGCSGGSSASTTTIPTPPAAQQNGTVSLIVSDDPTEDWATIGVKVLSVSLVPQGGGTAVNVYTAPATVPLINLVQLDQLGEILGNVTVPVGTYTAANLTLSANNTGTSCDVSLVASGDPEAGFDVPAGTAVPCSQTVIAGATGAAGSMTVPVTVNLQTPLTVATTGSNALDLEFDLRHPALIVEHDPAGASAPTWAINFNGPIRHHPHPDLTKVLLRHVYGQISSVSTDNTSITIDRAFPVHPITTPETATVDSSHTLSVLADATNGTLFYDLDTSSTPTTITSFSSVASNLPNLFVRIAARFQQDGTLVATRIYASKTFDTVWRNPEGHVLHVNTTTNVMHVTTEDGNATAVAIGPNTNFYFGSSNTVIGTGTSFFDGVTPGKLPNLARGFKVNATTDPLSTAKPPVALTVEIDVARYDGAITSPTTTQFNYYQRIFAMADGRSGKDDYSGSIDYATGPTVDQAGVADPNGFYWWNFEFPTLEDNKSTAVADFVSATDGSVNFGGTVGALTPQGLSNATWNDPAASDTWAAMWTVLLPVKAPIGAITSAWSPSTNSFVYTVPLPASAPSTTPPATPVTVDLTSTSGSATLVYQVDRQAGVITITPQDISNPTTLATVGAELLAKTPVKVFGVPQVDGSIKAYTLFFYTHTASTK
jgi:hypothetical protein